VIPKKLPSAAEPNDGRPPRSSSRSHRLSAVADSDWNFADVRVERGLHSIHPYPAKFIPQIPRRLIELLEPDSNGVVFDPFCGSGTTLLEAQAAGYAAIGVDLNPVATLIARAKTRPPHERLAAVAHDVAVDARRCEAKRPTFPNADHWFALDVQQALASLSTAISAISNELVREALQVAFSSIVVRVSNQDGDTRYAAVEKNTSAELVFELFERAATDFDIAYERDIGGLFSTSRPGVRVITKDVLLVAPSDIPAPVSLVVTSPPYPNAYEYWLYHKYRMYWLGYDPIAVRRAEIGARPHYFKKDHQTEHDFAGQMGRVFDLLSRVMLPDAFACFIVGRSIIHGRTIDNVALLKEAAKPYGLRGLLTIDRAIPSTRKAFNPRNGAIDREFLIVFGR